jgi:hypothetical protein
VHEENVRKFTETRARTPRACFAAILCRPEAQYKKILPSKGLILISSFYLAKMLDILIHFPPPADVICGVFKLSSQR